jgi:thiamine transport system permease protein
MINLNDWSLKRFLGSLSSKRSIRILIYACAVIFFFALILLPPILGIILKWNLIGQIFEDPNLMSRATSAIYASFAIAIFVSIVDLIAGFPMAWFIWKGRSKWLSALDTLADIPFIIPTVTLGYSLLLFWSDRTQGVSSLFGASLVSPGWLLIILLHFVFSYPAVVRVMVGALFDYERTFEEASRTLGAVPLTADRTVTFPILKPSFIAAFTLAFARSISETGATIMVAGVFENGPVLINNLKTTKQPGYEGALVFVSFILIAISSIIFATIRVLGPKLKMPVKKVWPVAERKLSSHGMTSLRNTTTLLIFFGLVLAPALFVALPAVYAISNGTLNEALSSTGVWQGYWQSLFLSYVIGAIVTLLNTVIGLPMAILIARKRLGALSSTILDVLVNIPMIVPSIALGVSLSIFWKNLAFIPEIVLLIFAHLSITYPYFVRSMTAAVERVNIDFEEASRTLGAKPFTVFRTVILPLTKYSLFAGAIMVFTRSVDETGATLAVATQLKTAPVLLVDWVKGTVPVTSMEIGLGCGFLVILSFIILLVLRLTVRGKY